MAVNEEPRIDHKMIKLVESLSKDYAAYQKQLTEAEDAQSADEQDSKELPS